jgi:hypothetical protein
MWIKEDIAGRFVVSIDRDRPIAGRGAGRCQVIKSNDVKMGRFSAGGGARPGTRGVGPEGVPSSMVAP